MENKELKIGQRIELFQVINPSEGYQFDYPIGIIRKGEIIGDLCFIDTEDCSNNRPLFLKSTYFYSQEAKPIGAFIIKSLK